MEFRSTTDPGSLSPAASGVAPISRADSEGHAPDSQEPTSSSARSHPQSVKPPRDVNDAIGSGIERPFSFFLALRAIFLLYAAVAVIAALGYEIWCVLTR